MDTPTTTTPAPEPADPNATAELIRAINAFAPNTLNGAVLFHMDKETGKLKTISPIVPVTSTAELYERLRSCRDGITSFLNTMVDRGLAKN